MSTSRSSKSTWLSRLSFTAFLPTVLRPDMQNRLIYPVWLHCLALSALCNLKMMFRPIKIDSMAIPYLPAFLADHPSRRT